MIRIINNTDQDFRRLLVLYSKEIDSVKSQGIECIVFNSCSVSIFGIDCLLLEVIDAA
jgi:hypothetical protein